ncbi:hypothetical protein U1Q18_046380 [Sarracenia purpurea var. burkii]
MDFRTPIPGKVRTSIYGAYSCSRCLGLHRRAKRVGRPSRNPFLQSLCCCYGVVSRGSAVKVTSHENGNGEGEPTADPNRSPIPSFHNSDQHRVRSGVRFDFVYQVSRLGSPKDLSCSADELDKGCWTGQCQASHCSASCWLLRFSERWSNDRGWGHTLMVSVQVA